MKYTTLLLLTITYVVFFSTVQARADSKTPITETSYQVISASAYHSCIGDNGGIDLRKVKGVEWASTYCGCAAVAATANVRQITAKYNLHYEEEWLPHIAEAVMSKSQINVCKDKANN